MGGCNGRFKTTNRKRRTFAIISHPDAGKTTLTEKFLLYGGAIQQAGTVKGKKIVSMRQVTGWKLKNKEGFQLPLQYYNLITKDIVLIFLILQGIKTSQKIHIVL